MKMFVLGRPGSGKTTAFHHISRVLENDGWEVERIRDYNILRKMFLADKAQRQFRQTLHGGFDVTDFSVLDEVLEKVEKEMKAWLQQNRRQKSLVMAEFARDDYVKALRCFSSAVLNNTHILYVDADLETCIQRIHNRVLYGKTADDHFVSEAILRTYYGRDTLSYMAKLAQYNTKARKAGYDVGRVISVIRNMGSSVDFYKQVDTFIETVQAQERVWSHRGLLKERRMQDEAVRDLFAYLQSRE